MGCGSSKAVVAVEPCKMDLNGNSKNAINLEKSASSPVKKQDDVITENVTSSKVRVKSASNSGTFSIDEKRNDSLYGSSNSLKNSRKVSSADRNSRVGSGSSIRKHREASASSRATNDSGICDSDRNSVRDENIITEESSPSLVKKIEVEERPPTPEFSLEGHKVAERGSGKARHRKALMEARKASSRNLPTLEGASSDPFKRPGSVAFDVMLCPDVGNVKKKPERLARLEQQSDARRKKKSKKAVSKTDIEKKLQDAEERRKNLEHEKQNKARLLQRAAHSETPVMVLAESDIEEARAQDFL